MTPSNESSTPFSINPQLVEILCCPETKQNVAILDQARLENLNKEIAAGELKNKSGAVVKEKLDAALIRSDQSIAYPIREGIPIMLIEEGILMHGLS